MVFDETTLTNAKLFFSPDLLKYEDDKDNVFHAEWIKNNILLPCLDVVNLISNKNTKTQKFGWIAVQSDVEILFSNRLFKLVHLYISAIIEIRKVTG